MALVPFSRYHSIICREFVGIIVVVPTSEVNEIFYSVCQGGVVCSTPTRYGADDVGPSLFVNNNNLFKNSMSENFLVQDYRGWRLRKKLQDIGLDSIVISLFARCFLREIELKETRFRCIKTLVTQNHYRISKFSVWRRKTLYFSRNLERMSITVAFFQLSGR